jgi:nucleotide-binding universal stress UspA family protein
MAQENKTPTLTFGDDGSPAADVAWGCIDSHAWPDWRLDVVTAHLPPIGTILPRDAAELHSWSPPEPRRPRAETCFVGVRHLTADADPRLVLLRAGELLVIGPRGPGLLKALHLGSTADWLLVHPPAPMLIARHGGAIGSIVVCTDGSPHASRAIQALAQLPWVGQTDITVLTVDDGRVAADIAIDDARSQFEPTGAVVQAVVEEGAPTPVIHELLERRAPDLVVLGTRGLTGLRHLRVGSTANAIVRAARCSALVACDDAIAEPGLPS